VAVKPIGPIQVTDVECDGSFDKMLRRFTRRVREEGVLTEVRRRKGFMKPSAVRRVRKSVPRG
jgi:ribosomal protein S21